MDKLKQTIAHPFLLTAYAVIALLANNAVEIKASAGIRVLIIALVGTAILLLIWKALLKNWHRAGIAATIILLFFFTYGHIYGALKSATILSVAIGRHRLLAPAFLLILAVGLWGAIKNRHDARSATQNLNTIALIALLIPTYQIASFQIRTLADSRQDANASAEIIETQTLENEDLPDIYYIVLDAYARNDDLQQRYDYDNTAFTDALSEKGFYVVQCSQSNYAKTKFSLASSLNMDYLQNLGGDDLKRKDGDPNWVKIGRMIRRGSFRKLTESLGYKIVAFQTGFFWTEWDNADLYLYQDRQNVKSIGDLQTFGQISDFEAMFIKTTFGLALMDGTSLLDSSLQPIVNESPRRQKYEMVTFALDTLEEAAAISGPKFVFVHLVSPHTPYVIDANGGFVAEENDTPAGYIGQLSYLTERVLTIVDALIENSARPPIIIIQSDHGAPGTQTLPIRMNIFNALYLPEGDTGLYPDISPVNTFRLVSDTYFGTSYGLIEDVSYYSTSDDFFGFTIVNNPCEAGN